MQLRENAVACAFCNAATAIGIVAIPFATMYLASITV